MTARREFTSTQERELRAARLNNAEQKKTQREEQEDHDRTLSTHGQWLYGTQRNLYADSGDWS